MQTLVRKINARADLQPQLARSNATVAAAPTADVAAAATAQVTRPRNRAPVSTEDIVIRAAEAGGQSLRHTHTVRCADCDLIIVNGMSYVQTEAVLPASDTPEPLLSDYLVEAFAHPTTLVVPVASYSRTMHRPIAEPYGLDQATGPAYREDPPSTISYGGPAPPLESRSVTGVCRNRARCLSPRARA